MSRNHLRKEKHRLIGHFVPCGNIDSSGCFYLQLLLGWPQLPAADFRADLLAVGEVGFRSDAELRGGLSDPLALTALDVDASAPRIDGERGEEAVAVGASVFDQPELGVNLGRVTFIAIGATDPSVGGRVDV